MLLDRRIIKYRRGISALIKLKKIRVGNGYHYICDENTLPTFDREIPFVFDLGASFSALSPSSIIKNTDSKLYKYLDDLVRTGANKLPYSSVSNESYGIPLMIKNFTIIGRKVDFKFLLVKDILQKDGRISSIALLGTDFTDYCDYSHSKRKDIIISDFDVQGYLEHPYNVEYNELYLNTL